MTQRKLLVVSPDPKLVREVGELAAGIFQVVCTKSDDQTARYLVAGVPLDVLLVDHASDAPVGNAIRLLERAREQRPDVRRGLLTGYGDLGEIIRALHKETAQFVLHCPVVPAELLAALALVSRSDAVTAARATGVAV
jgi:DNA-binding NarL/FixJ family response regulator